MIARALGVAIALSTIFTQPASAASPIGEWRIEPSDARCVAVRQYGTAEKPITLALKAPAIDDALQLAILRSGYRKAFSQSGATLKFDEEVFSANALSYPIGGDKRRITDLINLDSAQSGAFRKANSLKISIREGINDTFPLGNMSWLRVELDKCVERLRQTWNVGQLENRFASGPKGNLRPVFTADDYPKDAQRANQQGSARFIVLIDEEGRPRDCTLLETSGVALLDSRSCGLIMQRASFSPARDSSGKPMKSSYTQRINWRLEG